MLTGAVAPSPEPPLLATADDEFVAVGLLPPPAASAVGAAASESAASVGMIDRVIRKSCLFLRPAGLAVGLARKEPRLPRIHRGIRPGKMVPPLRGFRDSADSASSNIQKALPESADGYPQTATG